MSALELEHILFRLHSRLGRAAASTPRLRNAIQVLFLSAALLSLGVFLWLHTHYVGPTFGNDQLSSAIEGAIQHAGGLDNIDLLRVRVVTPRTAALDALRQAVLGQITAEPIHDGNGIRRNLETSDSVQHLRLSGCAASSGSCYAAVESSGPEPSRQLSAMADRVAAYMLARQRGDTAKLPAGELVSWTASVIASTDGAAEHELALAAAVAVEPQMDRPGDRIAAKKDELYSAIKDAMKDGDVLSPYRVLISALITEKQSRRLARGRNPGGALTRLTRQVGSALTSTKLSAVEVAGMIATALQRRLLNVTVPDSDDVLRNVSVPFRLRSGSFWAADDEAEAILRPLLRRRGARTGADEELLTMLLTGIGSSDVAHVFQRDTSYTFTTDKGLLSLEPRRRDRLHLRRAELDIPADSPLLGDPYSRWLLEHYTGYDVPMLNAFSSALVRVTQAQLAKATAEASGSHTSPIRLRPLLPRAGWVSVDHLEEVHAMSEATEMAARLSLSSSGLFEFGMIKLGTLCSAVFLLFATSSLVSFILAQTQQRMLRFTVSLQSYVRARLPLGPLLASHMVDSLIFVPIMLGVLFFMFSFFTDQLLAFLVMLAVWVCEVQNIIGCRTDASMRVFPRVFGLLMTWFHAYYLAFPFGFAYPAFHVTCLGLLTAEYHLWNRYELPALMDGSISVHMPRAPAVTGVMVAPWAGPEALAGGHGDGIGAAGHGQDGAAGRAGQAMGGPTSQLLGPTLAPLGRPVRAGSASSVSSVASDIAGSGDGHRQATGGGGSVPMSPGRATGRQDRAAGSPLGTPGRYQYGIPPLSPGRGLPLTGLGLLAASSPLTATYREPSLSDVSLSGLFSQQSEQLPVGVGIAAAAEAASSAAAAASADAHADVDEFAGPSAGGTPPGSESQHGLIDHMDLPQPRHHQDNGHQAPFDGSGAFVDEAEAGTRFDPVSAIGSTGLRAIESLVNGTLNVVRSTVDPDGTPTHMSDLDSLDTLGLPRRQHRDGARTRGHSLEQAQQ